MTNRTLENISELFLHQASQDLDKKLFGKAVNMILLVVTELDDGTDVIAFISERLENLSPTEKYEFLKELRREIEWWGAARLKTDLQYEKNDRFTEELSKLVLTYSSILQDSGEDDLAIECINEALKLKPGDEDLIDSSMNILLNGAERYTNAKEVAKGEKLLEKAYRIASSDLRIFAAQARLYVHNYEFDKMDYFLSKHFMPFIRETTREYVSNRSEIQDLVQEGLAGLLSYTKRKCPAQIESYFNRKIMKQAISYAIHLGMVKDRLFDPRPLGRFREILDEIEEVDTCQFSEEAEYAQPEDLAPDELFCQKELRQILWDAIYGLQESQALVIMHRYVGGMTFRKIAESMQMPYARISSLHKRALETLKKGVKMKIS